MEQHNLTFNYQARYYKLGSVRNARQVWFVLHGYGQLAQYFMRKFKVLEEHGVCVIAPEGLSRFYLEDSQSRMQSGNNRVGATWMTRVNRETDIENYLNYLDAVYTNELPASTAPVTVLGFSQGAATASRWCTHGTIAFRRLVLWAGIFPPDMDLATGREILRDKEICMVYGKSDPFLNDERFAEMKAIQEKLQVTPRTIAFEGAHDMDAQTLLEIIQL